MKVLLLVFIAVVTAASSAVAQTSGVGGGGDAVFPNGRTDLRDFAEHCYWRPGAAYKDANYRRMITSLEQTHWYFARIIDREIDNLRICESSQPLMPIPENYRHWVTILPSSIPRRPLAIRHANRVYLDLQLHNRIGHTTPNRKVYFPVHEALHSFIAFPQLNNAGTTNHDDPALQRDLHLASMVEIVRRNTDPAERQPRLTPEEFAYQMENNQVSIIADLATLNPFRNDVIRIMTSHDTSSPEYLGSCIRLQTIRNLLPPIDQRAIDAGVLAAKTQFATAAATANLEQIQFWISNGMDVNQVLSCDILPTYTNHYIQGIFANGHASMGDGRSSVCNYNPTILHLAVANRNYNLVDYLLTLPSLRLDSQLSYTGHAGATALGIAINIRELGLVEKLLRDPRLDANSHYPVTTIPFELYRHHGRDIYFGTISPLLHAVLLEERGIVNALITRPTIDYNQTIEYFARIPYAHVDKLEWFYNSPNFDINGERARDQRSPITIAAAANNVNLLNTLLHHPRLSINAAITDTGDTTLMVLVATTNMQSTENTLPAILSLPALNLCARNQLGRTALETAQRQGQVGMATLIHAEMTRRGIMNCN